MAFGTVVGSNRNGADAGEVLPTTLNGLIRWATGNVVAGRQLKGRTFVPAPVEAENTTGGVVNAAYITGVGTAISALLGAANAELVIWSRPTPERLGSHGTVIGGTVWQQWAVQRGRR